MLYVHCTYNVGTCTWCIQKKQKLGWLLVYTGRVPTGYVGKTVI